MDQVVIKYKKDMRLNGGQLSKLLPPTKYNLVLFSNGPIGTRAAFDVEEGISEEEVKKDLTIRLFQQKPSIEIYSGTKRLN